MGCIHETLLCAYMHIIACLGTFDQVHVIDPMRQNQTMVLDACSTASCSLFLQNSDTKQPIASAFTDSRCPIHFCMASLGDSFFHSLSRMPTASN